MRHLMSPLDFSVEELDKLMDLANDMEANRAKYAHACEERPWRLYSMNLVHVHV